MKVCSAMRRASASLKPLPRAASVNSSISRNTYAGPDPEIDDSASICASGTSITTPHVSNSARTSATSSEDAAVPADTPVTAFPTTAGVFGIARTTGTPSPTIASKVARVTPAARLTTIVPGRSAGAISRSRSDTMTGFTPTSTMSAAAAAARLASGASASATEVTPSSPARVSAFAALRLVTVTRGARPERASPVAMAPPIEPAPRIAIVGRV